MRTLIVAVIFFGVAARSEVPAPYPRISEEVDMARIDLVDYSMGGMDAFYLLSVEPRVKAAVACVPPLFNPSGYGAMNPIDYSWGIRQTPFLIPMGRRDEMYDQAGVNESYRQYIETPRTKLVWYDKGHNLTAIYVPDALDWMKKHLIASEGF